MRNSCRKGGQIESVSFVESFPSQCGKPIFRSLLIQVHLPHARSVAGSFGASETARIEGSCDLPVPDSSALSMVAVTAVKQSGVLLGLRFNNNKLCPECTRIRRKYRDGLSSGVTVKKICQNITVAGPLSFVPISTFQDWILKLPEVSLMLHSAKFPRSKIQRTDGAPRSRPCPKCHSQIIWTPTRPSYSSPISMELLHTRTDLTLWYSDPHLHEPTPFPPPRRKEKDLSVSNHQSSKTKTKNRSPPTVMAQTSSAKATKPH